MKTCLRILSLFQVLVCVEIKNQSGNVFTGTEGGSVEIYCNYPDGYQYAYHYFCRHPCGYSDVLIKTERADKVTSKGRYSVLNTASARSFSVTIRNLRSGDSGVYYCGIDQLGKDTLSKVVVTVKKVHTSPIMTPASESSTQSDHQLTQSTVTAIATASAFGYNMPTYPRPASSLTASGPRLQSTSTTSVSAAELVVFGVQCGVVCALLAALLLFHWRSSTTCTCSSAICTK
ncbi:CMRF35-like molecule 5 isoform X2 [Pygocentrus nattereri]|uniref:CMRF35-like molecule 5 isoform X2 n=1 Tax=Pygocentrus nattereri TaxID=42514 RepID=UPI0008148C5C|nr:CMRF35-like molecule 5 isoform X2 [Pygocentrus nattereri]